MTITKALLSGLLFLALGIFVLVMIPVQIAEVDNDYGPRLFPKVTAILMIVASLGILMDEFLRRLRVRRENLPDPDALRFDFNPLAAAKFVFAFGMMAAYVFLFPEVGFLAASLGYVLVSLVFFRVSWSKWWYYPLQIVLVLAVYWVFKYPMQVQFP